jgi:hypothetical protein
MSIRANIILSETHSYRSKKSLEIVKSKRLIFYRKADGNPEAILPVINVYMRWIRAGKFRNNLGKSGSWLAILGGIENNVIPKFLSFKDKLGPEELNSIPMPNFWKSGSFEPVNEICGDIDFLYEIDINEAKLTIKKVSYIDEKQVYEVVAPKLLPQPESTHFDHFNRQ